jgi:hypothetical protein
MSEPLSVGFTDRDRETLTILRVELNHLVEQVKPALERLLVIERERVTRKDIEGIFEVLEEKADAAEMKQRDERIASDMKGELKERDERIAGLERKVDSLWWKVALITGIGIGGLGALRLLFHI